MCPCNHCYVVNTVGFLESQIIYHVHNDMSVGGEIKVKDSQKIIDIYVLKLVFPAYIDFV